MKLLLHFLLLIFLLTNCNTKNSKKKPANITGNIKEDVHNLLPEGNISADVMDKIKENKRLDELSAKFQAGIKENQEWFLQYAKTIPDGEPMPYHPNVGMTKEEYTELLGLFKDIQLISSGKENFKVKKEKNIIKFEATGKLEGLKLIQIDLDKNIVLLDNILLDFKNSPNITDDKNALRSKWKGYSWEYNNPKDLNSIDITNLQDVSMTKYDFTLGKLEKTGKTLLFLEGKEIKSGVKTFEFELRLIF